MSIRRVLTDAGRMLNAEKPPEEFRHEHAGRRTIGYTELVGGNGKFEENTCDINDPMEYERKGTDSGLVVIFNHHNFKDTRYDQRTGTFKDVEELIITLGRLKFNIDPKFIYTDLTTEELQHKIKDICEMNLENRNCLICIFLSHGEEDNKLVTLDGHITVDEIYEPFTKCRHLMNKPKFFLFQACKSEKFTTQEISNVDGVIYDKEIVCSRTLVKEIPSDVLLVYSTIEGEVSFRDTTYGSWFIQELCRNLTAYGRRDDVISMVIRTAKCVANNYCYEDKDIRAKQLPIFISTLTKKFYLTKSKERLYLLEAKKKIEDISREFDALKVTLNELCSLEGIPK